MKAGFSGGLAYGQAPHKEGKENGKSTRGLDVLPFLGVRY
jgi:hypothetical protein